jgi:serine/threonine-protein kinase
MALPSLQAGPYRLEQRLSSGGESHVWLATHARDGSRAVVKVQRSEVRPERLRREAAVLYALQALAAPNVVRPLPAGDDGNAGEPGSMHTWNGDEVLYCAMEPLPCEPSRNLVKQGPLKGRDAVDVCDALRQALRVMHLELEMIHNDLKPDNIVAWRDGRNTRMQVRLFDFGQAALLMPHPQATYACVTPQPALRYVYDYGSRPYQAPERWHGKSSQDPSAHWSLAAVDDRADQWSFAATVFKLLTGRTLVSGQGEAQIRQAILGGAYFATLDEARLPARAKVVLKRALALNPADRYQRAPSVSGLDFFCRDLEAALA